MSTKDTPYYGTYTLVIRSVKMIKYMEENGFDIFLRHYKDSVPLYVGDAMFFKDEMLKAGFQWFKDFYFRKSKNQKQEKK